MLTKLMQLKKVIIYNIMLLLFAIPCPLVCGGLSLWAKRANGWGIVKVPKIWALG